VKTTKYTKTDILSNYTRQIALTVKGISAIFWFQLGSVKNVENVKNEKFEKTSTRILMRSDLRFGLDFREVKHTIGRQMPHTACILPLKTGFKIYI